MISNNEMLIRKSSSQLKNLEKLEKKSVVSKICLSLWIFEHAELICAAAFDRIENVALCHDMFENVNLQS